MYNFHEFFKSCIVLLVMVFADICFRYCIVRLFSDQINGFILTLKNVLVSKLGDDIGSGSVCIDFRATNVVHLSMSSMVA